MSAEILGLTPSMFIVGPGISEKQYQIGPVSLHVAVHDPTDEQRVHQLLDDLFWLSPVTTATQTDKPELSLQLVCQQSRVRVAQQLPQQAKSIITPYLNGDGFRRTPEGIYFDCPGGGIEVWPHEGHAMGLLDGVFWHTSLYDQRCLFLRTLITLFRQRGLYSIHASAVQFPGYPETDGQGVLVVGRSGAGKTTLTLGLIDSGWHFLGDNVVGIERPSHDALLQARALQRGFSCTQTTLAFYPRLRHARSLPLHDSRGKQLVFAETVYPTQFTANCTPRILLFPEVTAVAQTTLVPLDETEAMLELLQQSPGLLTHVERTAEQLQMLRTLVQQTRAYRVHTGRDLIGQPTAVAALIAEVIQ